MWLIDENLHTQLYKVLAEFGITAHSVDFAGLSGLDNGILTREAFKLGFRCILTQDKDFPRDAEKALTETPEMALVVIRLPQTPAKSYLQRFRARWGVEKICAVPGKAIEWGGDSI